jgi:hypothetical protein
LFFKRDFIEIAIFTKTVPLLKSISKTHFVGLALKISLLFSIFTPRLNTKGIVKNLEKNFWGIWINYIQ